MNKNKQSNVFIFILYYLCDYSLARTILRLSELGCDIFRVKRLTYHVVDEHLTVLLQENVVKGLTVVSNLLHVFAHVCKVSSLDHLTSV